MEIRKRKTTSKAVQLAPVAGIARTIRFIRGQKIILDSDLAQLYAVETKNLNKAVKRNAGRFPQDFMFQLSDQEVKNLRFQIGTLRAGHGQHRKYLPYAFTELGVAMLSSVLNSERAVQMNILIMRAFVRLRELIASNKDLAARVEKLESGQQEHRSIIAMLVGEIDELRRLPEPKSRPIGFTANLNER